METLGIVFLVLIAAAVLVMLIIAIVTLPDMLRYRRLRRM